MAPGSSKPKNTQGGAGRDAKRPSAQRATEADAKAADDGDESDEAPPPMNRAQRRLEAKRKSGRNAPTRVTPNGMSSGDSMRGKGVQGGQGSARGTNTRRSG